MNFIVGAFLLARLRESVVQKGGDKMPQVAAQQHSEEDLSQAEADVFWTMHVRPI
jgi:hypothetical protein